MKKTIFLLLLWVIAGLAQAQFIEKVGKTVQRSAENATIRKADQKADQAVSKSIDKATDGDTYKKENDDKKEKGWTCPKCNTSGNTGKFCTQCGEKQPDPNGWTCAACKHKGNKGKFCADCGAKEPTAKNVKQSTEQTTEDEEAGEAAPEATPAKQQPKGLEAAYAKSDFVPGDEILFDDDVTREKLGEFPSQWDLKHGNAEIASMNGVKVINVHKNSTITPLMTDMKEYLPDVYTLEFDFFYFGTKRDKWFDQYDIEFNDKDNHFAYSITIIARNDDHLTIEWHWKNPSSGERGQGNQSLTGLAVEEFHRLAVSFNKRALKIYINGERTANIPNVAKASRFEIEGTGDSEIAYFIKNIRIAKGAVPLYDRMMSDGKFISYGITFDVGKSTIKPESLTELNRIVQLMQDNPTVKFSVEGHTDNTGTAATNQTLSDARSKAVLDKLVELGIDKGRLTSAGKGQNSPIADNATDEGRAKNRRVEFVKI